MAATPPTTPGGAPATRSTALSIHVEVCGETVADLVEQPDGRLQPVAGGSPANTALALARLGHEVSMLARISSDVFGQRALARLEDNDVHTDAVVAAEEPSTVAVVTVDDAGHPAYAFWTTGTADWQWTHEELAAHPGPAAALLHTASVAAWFSPGEAVIENLLRRARRAGVVVSYDPNARPPLMPDLDEARERIERKVRLADLVKVSDEDLGILYPDREWREVAAGWLGTDPEGPAVVVVTQGAEGATAFRSEQDPISVPGRSVEVADTVGAGDTFTAGLWHGIVGTASAAHALDGPALRAQLTAMTEDDWRSALASATAAAAVNCSRVGCDPPDAAALAEAL